MKIALVNAYDTDMGGAGRATYTLHCGLRQAGVDSVRVLQRKTTDDVAAVGPMTMPAQLAASVRPFLDCAPLALYRRRRRVAFATGFLGRSWLRDIERLSPDLVHLNWITAGMASIRSIASVKLPLIWTLHDSWAFTGGCHVPQGCERYRVGCGRCPILSSEHSWDLSRIIYLAKRRSWKSRGMTIVAPSQWLATCARASALFGESRIEVIPNAIDTSKYKPIDRRVARQILGLAPDKKYIAFGAMRSTHDNNKGFDLLLRALGQISESHVRESCELLIFGAESVPSDVTLPLPARFLGRLYDPAQLALVYSAADVFVMTSRQEAFGLSAAEAMACGTPVVAFAATGLLDVVSHLETGFLGRAYDPDDLGRGLNWLLRDPELNRIVGQNARKAVDERFSMRRVAGMYKSLYEETIARHRHDDVRTRPVVL